MNFKNLEENSEKPGRNSEDLEKISIKPMATLYIYISKTTYASKTAEGIHLSTLLKICFQLFSGNLPS